MRIRNCERAYYLSNSTAWLCFKVYTMEFHVLHLKAMACSVAKSVCSRLLRADRIQIESPALPQKPAPCLNALVDTDSLKTLHNQGLPTAEPNLIWFNFSKSLSALTDRPLKMLGQFTRYNYYILFTGREIHLKWQTNLYLGQL